MTKIMINYSHVPARWVFRHANLRRMLVNVLNNVFVVSCNLLRFGVNFNKILINKNIQNRMFFYYNNDIAAARVSYGRLREMQSMQKAVQLTTFCVISKEKNKCNFFKKLL